MKTSHYTHWRDEHGVVHWVESQLNLHVYTGCRVLIERLPHYRARSMYKGTWSHLTCVLCLAEAASAVYENPCR